MIEPTLRKPVGVLSIMAIIALWALLIVALSPLVERLPWPVEAVFYLVAGIAWIVPMGPILRWMETGQFRDPRKR